MEADKRLKYSITSSQIEIQADSAVPSDAGVYHCNLRNDFGQERVSIKVIVTNKPAQPQGPLEVSDIKADGCTLSWKPPKDDGGSPITNYIVEKFDTKLNQWQKVSSYSRVPFYEVIGLEEGRPYKFRVSAENALGESIPLETEALITPKNPHGLPDAPTGMNIAGQTSETVTLEWNPPSNDGGSKILGYNLEVQEPGSDDWFPFNESLIKGNSFTGNFKAIFWTRTFKECEFSE